MQEDFDKKENQIDEALTNKELRIELRVLRELCKAPILIYN